MLYNKLGYKMFVLLPFIALCMAAENVFDIMDDLVLLRAPDKPNFAKTVFTALESYHDKGTVATEKTYPWIAQVVQSKSKNVPYMCTAVCVHDRIFITASRCIYSLKIKYTTVIYRSKRLDARAFVVPSHPTVQQFDDIAFIVVEKKAGVTYQAAHLYTQNEVKRTDETFKFFPKMNLTGPFKAVGYVMDKKNHRLRLFDSPHHLRDLPVLVQVDICWKIVGQGKVQDFNVPCYHTCSPNVFLKKNGSCGLGYLGVEGAAVVHDKSKKVLGIATWGSNFNVYELPVGFSVVNSKVFVEDFECAKKVKNANAMPSSGSYQELCKR